MKKVEISYSDLSAKIKKLGLATALNVVDKAITYLTVLLYTGYLVYAFISSENGDYSLVYRSILIPAVSFAVVSIYRKWVSAPRPYEVYHFTPALNKDTKGKSFPSRHVFSIFMVAMTYLQTSMTGAILISVMGLFLMAIRVLGGAHFLKDVIAGMAIGLLCGFIGFGLLAGLFNIGMLVF